MWDTGNPIIYLYKNLKFMLLLYILGDHVKDALLVKFGWNENLKSEFHKEYILKRIMLQSCIKIVIYGLSYYSLVVKSDYHPYIQDKLACTCVWTSLTHDHFNLHIKHVTFHLKRWTSLTHDHFNFHIKHVTLYLKRWRNKT